VWGYRDLGVIRLAVDNFLEYGGVYLETQGNVVSIKLIVLEPYDLDDSDEGEHPRGARADFIRFLQNAADDAKLQLEFTRPHVGANMTVVEFAGDYLTTKDSGTLDWNYASGMLLRLDSLVEDAVRLFRAHHGTRAL
jgi:hypothetical protein